MASTSSTSSVTSSIVSTLGAGSGIDMSALAEQLAAAQFDARLSQLTTRNDKLTAKISAASTLKSMVTTLATSFGSRVREGDLAVQPAIANSSVAAVSKGTFTGSGSYTLEVTALASAQKLTTPAYAAPTATVGSGTLTLRFGTISGTTFTEDAAHAATAITIPSGATLTDVAAAINASGAGVSAYVANGTAGAQIVLKGKEGAANAFVLEAAETVGEEGLAALAWNPAGDATRLKASAGDAAYKLDDIAYTATSNTIPDAAQGLSLKLTGRNIGAPATITFSDPSSTITSAMQDLTDALNEIGTALKDALDPSTGELNGDSGARALRLALSQLAGSIVMPAAASGEPATLADLGLATERDGTFRLDTKRLAATLTANPSAASAMFTTGLYGVYSTLDKLGRNASSSSSASSLGGSITRYTAQQKTIATRTADLTADQEDMRTRLVSRFAVMDTNVAASQSTLSFLKAQIAAWNSSGDN